VTSLGKEQMTFDDDKAKKRIKSAMKRSGLWRHRYGKRIVPVSNPINEALLRLWVLTFVARSQEICLFHYWVYQSSDLKHCVVTLTSCTTTAQR
jgi:hypothetical protein